MSIGPPTPNMQYITTYSQITRKVVHWAEWEKISPTSSELLLHSVMKGDCFRAIFNAAMKHNAILKDIDVQVKPRAIIALKEFMPGTLILVPSSNSIVLNDYKTAMTATPKAGVSLGEITVNSTSAFAWLYPHVFCGTPDPEKPTMMVPAWIVPGVVDDELTNMAWDCDLKLTANPIANLRVPLLVNTRHVAKGDKLYVAKLAKKRTATDIRFVSATPEPPAKASKVV